jgi:hypothetical protein
MKYLTILISLIVAALLLLPACKDDNVTYAEELKAEQELINDFISRQQIQVVTVMPDFPWPDKVFYKSKSGMYFRLTKQGDIHTQDSIMPGDDVLVRFDQYTLGVKSDTISNRSTIDFVDPWGFKYMDYTQVCVAWHEAVGYMKYSKAEAQIIVPSKIGFSTFSRPATPIGYDMEIRINKY